MATERHRPRHAKCYGGAGLPHALAGGSVRALLFTLRPYSHGQACIQINFSPLPLELFCCLGWSKTSLNGRRVFCRHCWSMHTRAIFYSFLVLWGVDAYSSWYNFHVEWGLLYAVRTSS